MTGWQDAPAGWPDEPTGRLHLRIARRDGRSVVAAQYHRGALRVLRPHRLDHSGQVCLVSVNPGGGYLGGDTYLTELDVGPDASLLFTTQAATKIYRTPTAPARHHTHVRVAAGGVLEMVPDQVIAYRDARYDQSMTLELDPAATFVGAEVVTPGWSPDGTWFSYDQVRLFTSVSVGGRPVVWDNLVLRPHDGDVSGLGAMEGFSHAGSLLAMDRRVDQALLDDVHQVADAAVGVRAGLTLVDGPGLLLRALGRDTKVVADLLLDVDALLRDRWFGTARIDLRKW